MCQSVTREQPRDQYRAEHESCECAKKSWSHSLGNRLGGWFTVFCHLMHRRHCKCQGSRNAIFARAPSFRRSLPEGWETANPNPPFSAQRKNRVPHISILRCGKARPPTRLSQSSANNRCPSVPRFRGPGKGKTSRSTLLIPPTPLPSPLPDCPPCASNTAVLYFSPGRLCGRSASGSCISLALPEPGKVNFYWAAIL